ncbi:MAG: hypothetical protein ACTSRS_10740 [Candidatus Helarchaeota archaeon]
MKLKLKEFVFENETGGKVKLSFEGTFSPEDITNIIKKLHTENSNSHVPSNSPTAAVAGHNLIDQEHLSIREKLEQIVKEIKYGWFTSDHIRELFSYTFHEEIKPSTVSTYLARMFQEGQLERRGTRARREYRVAERSINEIQFAEQI